MDTQKATTQNTVVNAKPMTVPRTIEEAMNFFTYFINQVHAVKQFSIMFYCNKNYLNISISVENKTVFGARFDRISPDEFRYEFEKMNMFLRDITTV